MGAVGEAEVLSVVSAPPIPPGERILLYSGETARIAQKLPRPGPETVYNLEIWGEHVYHVGESGVLVHNSCAVSELQRFAAG